MASTSFRSQPLSSPRDPDGPPGSLRLVPLLCRYRWCSLCGLFPVDPFAGCSSLSLPVPSVHDKRQISGHCPAFNYYESSDSSEGIGLLFPLGLWHRLPVSNDPPTGSAPGPGDRRRRLRELSGPYEVSLDHLVNIVATACRNHLLRPLCLGRSDGGCRLSPGTPEEQGRWLPRASAGRHLNRPSTGSLSFKPVALPPPPPHPGSPRRTGHQLSNFNDQAREGLQPPCWRGCLAYDALEGRRSAPQGGCGTNPTAIVVC